MKNSKFIKLSIFRRDLEKKWWHRLIKVVILTSSCMLLIFLFLFFHIANQNISIKYKVTAYIISDMSSTKNSYSIKEPIICTIPNDEFGHIECGTIKFTPKDFMNMIASYLMNKGWPLESIQEARYQQNDIDIIKRIHGSKENNRQHKDSIAIKLESNHLQYIYHNYLKVLFYSLIISLIFLITFDMTYKALLYIIYGRNIKNK